MLIPFNELFKRWNINCTGILHCGSSTCQEAEMYDMLQVPEVVWVEAIPAVFEQGKSHILKYKNQVIINACIGDEDGKEVVFHVSNNEAQSSSYLELHHHSIIHPSVHYVEDIPMQTVRLDTLLKGWDIKQLNFGNFDLQGSELTALKGMGDLINQFDYFYLEINKKETYKGCALVGDIDDFLKDFERVETSKFVGDSWGDALYIRKNILRYNY